MAQTSPDPSPGPVARRALLGGEDAQAFVQGDALEDAFLHVGIAVGDGPGGRHVLRLEDDHAAAGRAVLVAQRPRNEDSTFAIERSESPEVPRAPGLATLGAARAVSAKLDVDSHRDSPPPDPPPLSRNAPCR